jgi:hypothetical protein
MVRLGGRNVTGTKIRTALEAAGIEFIDENGGGPGSGCRSGIKRGVSRQNSALVDCYRHY